MVVTGVDGLRVVAVAAGSDSALKDRGEVRWGGAAAPFFVRATERVRAAEC